MKDAFFGRVNARDTYPKLTEIMLARDSQRSRIEFVPFAFSYLFRVYFMVCALLEYLYIYTFISGGYAPFSFK